MDTIVFVLIVIGLIALYCAYVVTKEVNRRIEITIISREIWKIINGVTRDYKGVLLTDYLKEIETIFPEYERGYVYTFWIVNNTECVALYSKHFMEGEAVHNPYVTTTLPVLSYSEVVVTKTLNPIIVSK